jgi:hypothetical protein
MISGGNYKRKDEESAKSICPLCEFHGDFGALGQLSNLTFNFQI